MVRRMRSSIRLESSHIKGFGISYADRGAKVSLFHRRPGLGHQNGEILGGQATQYRPPSQDCYREKSSSHVAATSSPPLLCSIHTRAVESCWRPTVDVSSCCKLESSDTTLLQSSLRGAWELGRYVRRGSWKLISAEASATGYLYISFKCPYLSWLALKAVSWGTIGCVLQKLFLFLQL